MSSRPALDNVPVDPALDKVGILDNDSPLANRTEEPGPANLGIDPYVSDPGILKPENRELDSGVVNPEKRVVSKSSNPAKRAIGVDSCIGIPVATRASRTSDSPNGNRLARPARAACAACPDCASCCRFDQLGARPARAACAACPDRTSCCRFDQLGTRRPPITASDGKLRLNGAVRLNGLTNDDDRRLIDAALPIPDSSLVLPVSPFVSAPRPAPF